MPKYEVDVVIKSNTCYIVDAENEDHAFEVAESMAIGFGDEIIKSEGYCISEVGDLDE